MLTPKKLTFDIPDRRWYSRNIWRRSTSYHTLHPRSSKNEERNKFFEENQTGSLLQLHFKMTLHWTMRQLEMTSGLLREISFVAVTWNPKSNGTFLESAELSRQGGKLFLCQPSGGLPGLHDSPKRWFLEVFNFLRNIGWKCLLLWMSVSSYSLIWSPRALEGILCLHVDDLSLGGCGTTYR